MSTIVVVALDNAHMVGVAAHEDSGGVGNYVLLAFCLSPSFRLSWL